MIRNFEIEWYLSERIKMKRMLKNDKNVPTDRTSTLGAIEFVFSIIGRGNVQFCPSLVAKM